MKLIVWVSSLRRGRRRAAAISKCFFVVVVLRFYLCGFVVGVMEC